MLCCGATRQEKSLKRLDLPGLDFPGKSTRLAGMSRPLGCRVFENRTPLQASIQRQSSLKCFLPFNHYLKKTKQGTPRDQISFIMRAACFAKLKGAVGLIMAKASAMRISISLDLSSRPFIPLPRVIRSRRPTPLLAPSLVLFPPCSS